MCDSRPQVVSPFLPSTPPFFRFVIVLIWLIASLVGCSKGHPPVAPVSGRVLYRGQPLAFGGIMFQPEAGWPARGIIEPDGSFKLSTYGLHDGAVLGTHRVRITCFESQRPGATSSNVEAPVGKPLIPAKYANIDTSGLVVEVRDSNEPVVFNLAD